MYCTTRLAQLVLVLALLLGSGPAAADWLVTLEGDEIETRGPWEIKEKLVVFTLPNGSLSSMRLADIDVDASEQRTMTVRYTNRRAEPSYTPKQAVLVITDDDVGHVQTEGIGTSIDRRKQAGGDPGLPQEQGDGGLAVATWDQIFDESIDGVVVSGRVENRAPATHTDITLQLMLYNGDGTLAGRAPATLAKTSLKAGEESSFRASFPGVTSFDRPDFRLQGIDTLPKAVEAKDEAEAEEEDTD
jgi:hypothetical protein